MSRVKRINILVTGTPGCGKTFLCQRLKEDRSDLFSHHIEVGAYAKERGYIDSYDEERDTHVLDEDKLLDDLENIVGRDHRLHGELVESDVTNPEKGVIIDCHSSDWFPERWIDLVVILRASIEVLSERLSKRDYPDRKIQENLEAEIMQVSADEARESYSKVSILEFTSDSMSQFEDNFKAISEELDRLADKRKYS